jgi:hypothetical protein
MSVDYNGFSYAALDLQRYPGSQETYCQNYYLPLPAGWSVAPHNSDSIAVIALYPWGTQVMSLQDGSYWTSNANNLGYSGQMFANANYLEHNLSTNSYRTMDCNLRILLMYTSGIVSSVLPFAPWTDAAAMLQFVVALMQLCITVFCFYTSSNSNSSCTGGDAYIWYCSWVKQIGFHVLSFR